MNKEKQISLVTKVVIGFGILLVFVIALSWYNDQGLLISYAGSRPDIPITINIDNSLNLEDQRADLLVKMQDVANEYGCPENGGSNNALGPVQVMEDYNNIQVADVGCNDGTTSILFFAVVGNVPPITGGVEVSYIGSRSDIPVEIHVDTSLTSDNINAYLLAKMQVASNEYGCPENGGSNNALGG